MTSYDVERLLKRAGARPIDNKTLIGTYCIVEADKFVTKGISNRDNARWKRAQYIVVEHCPTSSVKMCVDGFVQFSEFCQFLIIANTNQAFNGNGRPIDFSHITSIK